MIKKDALAPLEIPRGFDLDADQRKLRSLTKVVERRGPPTWAFGILSALSLVAALLMSQPSVQVGLVAFGLALAGLTVFSLRSQSGLTAAAKIDKRARTALEDGVRALISQDPDPAFLTDPEGEIRFANAAAQEKFGTACEDHLTTVFSRVLANPEVVLYRLQTRAFSLGSAKEDIVTRNGQFRLSVVQVSEDTHFWRMDESGAAAKTGGRSADQLTLPMMTVGPSDAILYLNEAFRKILGSRPKSMKEVFGPGVIASGQIVTLDLVDGPSELLIAVVPGPAGRREVYALPAPDLAAPRALRGDWNAIEDLPVPLLKIGETGEILASNREARLLLSIGDTTGKRVQDVLDGLGRPIQDWLREALNGQGGNVSQFLRGRGDNHETFVQVTLNVAARADGGQLIAVLNDVTELKTLEGQFVQSQKMQAIGQLAGGVAHDFNNLLTAISGHCDLLLLRHDQGDQDYGDLIQIHQNANRAASLVGQLLAFSRKQNLQPERIDLRDTLSDLTHLLNRLVGEKVRLSLDHDPELATIKADKRQLEQVMMNLVVNARDAMPSGGEIRVITENLTLDQPLEKDRASVPAGDYVVVKVIDEGHGIPPERLPKIFEPFYTTKRTGEGTGLGLSTVYGIVKQTGGFIFATSDESSGTEFQLLFPAYTLTVAETLPVAVEPPQMKMEKGDGVVLLVEDEAPVRAFASRALQLRGYTVLEADSAEAALEMLSDSNLSVDIFVTDVIMPGKDGPTWVREALIDRPDTKVVFVSGYAEDAFADDDERIPNSVFLPKPFSLTELTQTVQGQLH